MTNEHKQPGKQAKEPELRGSDEEIEDLDVPEAEAEAVQGGGTGAGAGAGAGKISFNPYQITRK
jgi:hypothetical protein